jgi:hypothetical protein
MSAALHLSPLVSAGLVMGPVDVYESNVPSICTLHQTKASISRTLDQCILLAPSGKIYYAGCTNNVTAYFMHIGYECPKDTNPAEFL